MVHREPSAAPVTIRKVFGVRRATTLTVGGEIHLRPLSACSLRVATVTVMITSFDDYPIHQTWQPVAHPATGDPNHYDRYFFNGYTRDGSIFFATAMGLYPNRHVMDASFSVVYKGEQINLHASARAHDDRMKCTTVGPIDIQILEPLKRHRIVVASSEHHISAQLEFTASSLPYEEPPFLTLTGNRTTMQYTRLTQLGAWSGWIEVDGDRIDIEPTRVVGSRDRSWGIRGVGERIQLGAPPAHGPQFYWLWAPVVFDGFGTMFDVNEFQDGERWHQSGALLRGTDTVQHAHNISYDFTWEENTRRAQHFSLEYTFASESLALEFEPLLHFQMYGLGYLNPEWGHGMWKGDLVVGSDRFALPVGDPMAMNHLHVQTLSTVSATHSNGSVFTGVGVLETLVLGAHEPSGFSGLSDGYIAR